MKRKHSQEDRESGNQDRWLLTYSDLITLLLGLFVILYAMSKIDTAKYAQVVVALGGVFGTNDAASTRFKLAELEHTMPEFYRERASIESSLKKALRIDSKNPSITLSEDERGVTVHLQEQLLFNSGSAELKATSLATLDELAETLRAMPNDVRVEGHTDNVPISTAAFPSNWHLSVGRALNVGYYMIEKHGMNPEKVSVVGYSEYHPLLPNTTDENRARNRRVDIVVVTQTSLKPDAAGGDEHRQQ